MQRSGPREFQFQEKSRPAQAMTRDSNRTDPPTRDGHRFTRVGSPRSVAPTSKGDASMGASVGGARASSVHPSTHPHPAEGLKVFRKSSPSISANDAFLFVRNSFLNNLSEELAEKLSAWRNCLRMFPAWKPPSGLLTKCPGETVRMAAVPVPLMGLKWF